MKKVWFVAHYAMPPQYEMRWKTYKYAKILQEQGYDVTIFSASTIHNKDINLITDGSEYIEREYDGLKFIHINVCNYKGTASPARIINMRQFSSRFRKIASRDMQAPDAIVSDANIVAYKPIWKYCKEHNVKFILDMRDLWPEGFVDYLGFSRKNPFISACYARERKMYQRCDDVTFSIEGYGDYIKERGWENKIDMNHMHYINNGVDIEETIKNRQENVLEDADLTDDSKFRVCYVGSIRLVNNIGKLVDCAALLKDREPDVRILVYGIGDQEEALKKRCEEEGLDNILFKGFVDKKYIPYILSTVDSGLLVSSKVNLMRFGTSLNKHFDYMAAGKPIISNIRAGYDMTEKYNCGIVLDNDNAEDLAEAIIRLKNMSKEEYEIICKNCTEAAKLFDYRVLTEKLRQIIEA